MTTSPVSPRAILIARSRKHFAAIAATGIVMTGALTACAATHDSSNSSTDPATTSDSGAGTTGNGLDSGAASSSGSGVTSPDQGSRSSDGGSNAS